MIIVLGISEQEDFHRPEIPLIKTREIDNEARISKKAEMKRKLNRSQKCINRSPWDIQLSSLTFLLCLVQIFIKDMSKSGNFLLLNGPKYLEARLIYSLFVKTLHIFWNIFLSKKNLLNLKLVSAIFYQIFISHQMIALQKLWKMLFISSKKLFLFSRYSDFCISVFPSFSPCQPLL